MGLSDFIDRLVGRSKPIAEDFGEPDMSAALEAISGRTMIAECVPRHVCVVAGEVETVGVSVDGECTIFSAILDDDSGVQAELVWHGRQHVPGVSAGAFLSAKGTVSKSSKRKTLIKMVDPSYTLLCGGTDG